MFLILIFETSKVWVIVRSENPNIVAQSLSHVWLFAALWMAAEKDRERPPPSPGVHSDSRISSRWCHPTTSSLSSPSPPTFNLSQHQGLSNESVSHIRYPKYWSFSFSISSSSEYSGLISFRMDWFDLLAVQETQEFYPTSQFESISSSTLLSWWFNSHICTWLLEKP